MGNNNKPITHKPSCFIYILLCEDNKYYIGRTSNPCFRLQDHFAKDCQTKQENGESSSSNELIVGYCIRCKGEVQKNISKPYCQDCYRTWSKYKNISYIEPYCHLRPGDSTGQVEIILTHQ